MPVQGFFQRSIASLALEEHREETIAGGLSIRKARGGKSILLVLRRRRGLRIIQPTFTFLILRADSWTKVDSGRLKRQFSDRGSKILHDGFSNDSSESLFGSEGNMLLLKPPFLLARSRDSHVAIGASQVDCDARP